METFLTAKFSVKQDLKTTIIGMIGPRGDPDSHVVPNAHCVQIKRLSQENCFGYTVFSRNQMTASSGGSDQSTNSEHPVSFPHTADVAIFKYEEELQLLLIRRGSVPYRGDWALPGGFIEEGEPIGRAARRELLEETGLEVETLRELGIYGAPGRDPRGRVITSVYFGYKLSSGSEPTGGTDADSAEWHPLFETPPLAFDHDEICSNLIDVLRRRFLLTTDAFQFLEEPFSGDQLYGLYESLFSWGLPSREDFLQSLLDRGILGPETRDGRLRDRTYFLQVDREEFDVMIRSLSPFISARSR